MSRYANHGVLTMDTHRCTMGYYSPIKRNRILRLAILWVNLKNMMLSKRSQPPWVTESIILFKCSVQNKQSHRGKAHWPVMKREVRSET